MTTNKKSSKDIGHDQIVQFLQELPPLEWKETLIGKDLENQLCTAKGIIQCISLCHYCKSFSPESVHVKSTFLVTAIKFLSKEDNHRTLDVLKTMLEDLSECKSEIILKLALAEIRLITKSVHILKTIVVSSISLMLPCFEKNLLNQKCISDISKLVILTLTLLPNCPLSEFYLFTLGLLTKKSTIIKIDQNGVLSGIFDYLNQTCDKDSEIYANDIANYIIKNMKTNRKIRLFDKINECEIWSKGHCAIFTHLVNNWPKHIPLDIFLHKAAPRLAAMIFDPSATFIADIVKVTTKYMSFKTWNQEFMKNITHSPSFQDEKYIAMAFSQCVSLGIECFGPKVYEDARNELLSYFASLALFYSVRNGCINAMDYRDDIDILLRTPEEIIQRFAFKALCTFLHIDAEFTTWHIKNVKYYLESASCSSEVFYLDELNYLFSHMIIQANNIIKDGKQEKIELENFVSFSEWLYEFSMASLLSNKPAKIEIGEQVFILLQHAFGQDSSNLTTCYELEKSQHYGCKESPFYKHLVQLNKFFYDKHPVYQKVLNNFLVSETVHVELISFLEKWYVINGPCDSDYMQAVLNSALKFLELGNDEVSTKKGSLCVYLILLHKTLYAKDHDSFIEDMFNKWRDLVTKLLDNTSKTKQMFTVYSYTVCVFSLLRVDFVDGVQPVKFFHKFIECFKDVINQYVNQWLINKYSNSGFNVRMINIEQTILIILDMIMYLLNIRVDEKLIIMAIDIANQVIENNVGTSVVFKQIAKLREKAVKQRITLDEE